jgi:hypothetical protein
MVERRDRAPSLIASGARRAQADGRSVAFLPAVVAALREGASGPGVVFPEAAEAAALQLRGHLLRGARGRAGLPEATAEDGEEPVRVRGAKLPGRVGGRRGLAPSRAPQRRTLHLRDGRLKPWTRRAGLWCGHRQPLAAAVAAPAVTSAARRLRSRLSFRIRGRQREPEGGGGRRRRGGGLRVGVSLRVTESNVLSRTAVEKRSQETRGAGEELPWGWQAVPV